MTKRGLFVVLEGVDRAGKSTQCQRLVDQLNSSGRPARLMRFPDRDTPIGGLIGRYLEKKLELDDHAVHLLFSANRWELKSRILETVASGVHVVCDRYAYSGVAFSSAKANGPDLAWCCQPEVGLPAPDLKIFLSISPESQRGRGGFGSERYEVSDLQRRVGQAYALLMAGSDGATAPDWLVVNAEATPDEVQVRLSEAVLSAIEAPRDTELGRLAFPPAAIRQPLAPAGDPNTRAGADDLANRDL